ncbi:unnamed protein product [Caenorhabditis bovis]|uniref:Pepsin inhibitor-3-like repeated domain-containing protein n=1 Tax=Caenorhabditis bovis TaxID=2654633 RepID=A0A8S1EU88_9PELO|nr:unnamed protein product [Caenorhabditis bovis]
MITRLLLFTIFGVILAPTDAFFVFNNPEQIQPGYGYVGPACAVFEGVLFLHGVSKRKLSHHELFVFQEYQNDLSRFKDASTSFDSFEESPPIVPTFCGGFDDSIEVVLDSCIVRNNHVYVGDNLIRALTNFEKQKIEMVKVRKMYGTSRKRRIRAAPLPGTRPQHDFSEMIHKLLNVNSTVTSRFLPVVSQSPLFAMEGPWQSILNINKDAKFAYNPTVDITKIDNPYRGGFTTTTIRTTTTTTTTSQPPKKPNLKKAKKPAHKLTTATSSSSTTKVSSTPSTTTVREISLPSFTTTLPERTTRVETVVNPIILRLIAKALENNELVDETAISEATRQPKIEPLNLRFVVPPALSTPSSRIAGPAHNHLFVPNQSFLTSLATTDRRIQEPTGLSHRLPNEICRAHLKANPFFF